MVGDGAFARESTRGAAAHVRIGPAAALAAVA